MDTRPLSVTVPDLGEAEGVEVVEILVAVGETVAAEQSLVVLESDKASLEVPAPAAGVVAEIHASVGLEVTAGSPLLELQAADAAAPAPGQADEPVAEQPAEETRTPAAAPKTSPPSAARELLVTVPDAGEADKIELVELLVGPGDRVQKDDPLLVLESDKASMEVPAPAAGEVLELMAAVGAVVTTGAPLLKLGTEAGESARPPPAPPAHPTPEKPAVQAPAEPPRPVDPPPEQAPAPAQGAAPRGESARVYAGPSVRKQARHYGVNLARVKGTGRKGRIQIEDVRAHVREQLKRPESSAPGLPTVPLPDFSRFGEIEQREMSRIRRASARNLHRGWLNTPQVTQFDLADISALEEHRRGENIRLRGAGVKLTFLAFLIKAAVKSLQEFPTFNSSLNADATGWTLKKYYNIGIAVDTPDGLLVPVVRQADRKSLEELASECASLAAGAREGKLPLDALQGATFTISSLGGIGGTWFTPIVNSPEVAILGVSRSGMQPVWDGSTFVGRNLLPLCLTYDHRAIDGAEAARFIVYLSRLLADLPRLLS